MPRLLLDLPYQRRLQHTRRRLAALRERHPKLSHRWIAERIGRTRSYVAQVLNAHAYGPPTLARIAILLDQLDAGEVPAP